MPVTLGLLSDTHNCWERTKRAVAALQAGGATLFIHCGDVEDERVLDQLAGLDAHLVWGNCDWDRAALEPYARTLGIRVHGDAGELEIDGKRVAFTHGHLPAQMRSPVASGADYLIHGHTHERRDERVAGTRIINPGALHRASVYTVALLTPQSGDVRSLTISP